MRMNEKIRINYLLSKIKSPDFETRLSEIIQVWKWIVAQGGLDVDKIPVTLLSL